MVITVLFGLVHFAVAIGTFAMMYRATQTQRRMIQLGRYVVVASFCSSAIAAFSYEIAERIHRWRHPSDDWYDIVAFSSLALNICAIPVVGIIVTVSGRALERIRRTKYASCCERCGYDLTGISGQRCPECGTDRAMPAGDANSERP